MSLGRHKEERQQDFWVATADLPRSAGHVFYRKLNELLGDADFDGADFDGADFDGADFDGADFDGFVETLCEPFYHQSQGRPGIPPGVYFRMLVVGYFEGIGSQRGIAWQCADSLSLREFLGISLGESTPDHSSLTRVRDRLPLEVHTAVFQFVLQVAEAKGLLKKGKTIAVDATTLEANAAMKSIVRRDTGEDWKAYIRRLMQDAGEITEADSDTIGPTISEAQDHLIAAGSEADIKEAVADKGYHKNETLGELEFTDGIRTYIAEPKQNHRRNWKGKPEEHRQAVANNRRRIRDKRGRALQRQRSEKVERSFAHVCRTGGSRRTWLSGIDKVRKRYLMSAMSHNLGTIMRSLFGMGTARSQQPKCGLAAALHFTLLDVMGFLQRTQSPRNRASLPQPTATHVLALAT